MTNQEHLHNLTLELYKFKRRRGLTIEVAHISFPENQERHIIYWSRSKQEYVTLDINQGDKG